MKGKDIGMTYFSSLIGSVFGLALSVTTVCGEYCQHPPPEKAIVASASIPDEPDAAIATIIKETRKGNGGILWQALPESYQNELNEVVRMAADQIDDEVYDKGLSMVSRWIDVLEDKRDFTFNLSSMSREDRDMFRKTWPSIMGMKDTLISSQIGSIDGLRSFDGKEFFHNTVSDILKYVAELSKIFSDGHLTLLELDRLSVVSVVESDGDRVELKITVPNEPEETHTFVQVEGKWLPAEMVAEWPTWVNEAKIRFASTSSITMNKNKAQAMMILFFIESLLIRIEGATTQEEFENAFNELNFLIPFWN